MAQRPLRAGGGTLRGATRRAGRRTGGRQGHRGPADSGLRGMGGAASQRAASGTWSPRRRPRRSSTSSATPTMRAGDVQRPAVLRASAPGRWRCFVLGCSTVGRSSQGYVFIRHRVALEKVNRHALQVPSTGPQSRRWGRISRQHRAALSSRDFRRRPVATSWARSRAVGMHGGQRGEPRNKPPFPGHVGLVGQADADQQTVETFAHVTGHRQPTAPTGGSERARQAGLHRALKFYQRIWSTFKLPASSSCRWAPPPARAAGLCRRMTPDGRQSAAIRRAALPQLSPARQAGLGSTSTRSPTLGSMLGFRPAVLMAEGTGLAGRRPQRARFFRNESCGKCVPCRVGSSKAHRDAPPACSRPAAGARRRGSAR